VLVGGSVGGKYTAVGGRKWTSMGANESLESLANTRVSCYNTCIAKEEGKPFFRLYRLTYLNLIMKPSFYTRKEVLSMTTLSRSTIDRLETKGKFPKRLKLTANRVVWVAAPVDKWMKEVVANAN